MIRFRLVCWGLSVALAGAGCTPAQRVECLDDSSFCLTLSYRTAEESEDSNSTTETLTIEGPDVLYTWTYDGYHPGDDFDRERETSFTLTDEEFEGLIELIESSTLLTPVEESQTLSSGGAMAAESVEMTLDLVWEDQTVHTSIVGLTEVYMGNGESTSNVENTETLADVEKVLSFIRNAEGFPEESY